MVDLSLSCPGTKLNYVASGLDVSDAEFYACSEVMSPVLNELGDLEIFYKTYPRCNKKVT